jgi:hypothetical protein
LIYTANDITFYRNLLTSGNDIKCNSYWHRRNYSKEIVVSATLAFLFIAASFALNPITLEVYAEESSDSVVVKDQGSYVDSLGRLNIVGVVDNNGNKPISVKVGVNVISDIGNNHASSLNMTLTNGTYARIIYPSTSVPFKFVLEPGQQPSGKSYIESLTYVDATYYDILHLNYTNMAIGADKALVGSVKNVAPFAVHNVSVYASVHNVNRSQLDSVKSNIIPTINSGEEVKFMAKPDSSVKPDVYYFSCAGVDLDPPISTLNTADGRFIAYDLRGLVKISKLGYENSSDSMIFAADHYNPAGGNITLKIPQTVDNQKVDVLLDGNPYEKAKIIMDGKTVYIDIFIPPEEHNIQIKGVAKSI